MSGNYFCPASSRLLVVFLLLVFNSYLHAQHNISGRIFGTGGVSLPGASITVKATNKSTITDSTGRFVIEANSGSYLDISFIGYLSQQVKVGSVTELNISLSAALINLDEVMLVGYGTSRRKDLTGAVSKISSKDFNTGIITNPLQQIQGKVAGLVIVQPGGDPNSDFIVRIRGATSLEGQPPLLVIDGVALDDFNKAITTLNPADIESYDILKDAASSAIYGSRGANGVMLITTKKARLGKTSIEYNGFIASEKISNQLEVLSADQWRKATSTMNATGFDQGGNTNWQKVVTQTAFSQSHTLAISGGNDQLSFRGSVGYTNQEGIVVSTGKEVITARVAAIQKSFKNKLEIRYALNNSATRRDFLPDQYSTNYARSNNQGVFFQGLAGTLPVWPAYNADGSYNVLPNNNPNPLWVVNEIYSNQRENFFQGSIKADYEIINGFKLGGLAALSTGNDEFDHFFPGWQGNPADANKASYNKQIFSGDIHGNFHKIFEKHSFDITGVYEYNKFVNDGFGVMARGFLVPELLNNNLATATNITTNDIFSYKNESKLISLLGRLDYNFDQRYLLTANFRRDGSSKFGPNNRWGNFPSIAFAWRASNENFLKRVKWLDNLKLRVSYGFTGNQENLPPYAYQVLYSRSGPYLYNGQFLQSYAVTQENNPDLKWEVRKSFNIGVDFSIFGNRIYGTVDVFNDETSDMLFLYDIPQPPFISNKVYANAANAVNKGVEITIGAAIISNKKFRWDLNANFATLKNHITNLLGQFKGYDLSITNRYYGFVYGGGFGGTYATQLAVGYPAGVFWIPEHAGIDADGHELFNNYDATGKLIGQSTNYTDQDRVYIDPTPQFTWGITNTFVYRNVDLSFFLRGVQGQKIFANSLLNLENINYLPGRNVTHKASTNGYVDLPQPSTYWLRDGSYARLENVTIGYNVKNLKGFSKLRIYLTAINLFVITSYEGVDPEINTDGAQRYIDQNYYPKTRGFTFGVNLGL